MRGRRNSDTEFNVTLGKLMERRRLAEGLTRQQVLRLMDTHKSQSLLCGYENGSKPVSLPFALKWCAAMGLELTHILEAVSQDMNRQPPNPAVLAGSGADSTHRRSEMTQ